MLKTMATLRNASSAAGGNTEGPRIPFGELTNVGPAAGPLKAASEQAPAAGISDTADLDEHVRKAAQGIGAIELIIGPMFAGKTTRLLQRVRECEAAGLKVALIKSGKDIRYSAGEVVSHDGARRVCHAVESLAAFHAQVPRPYWYDVDVVAIDEAQFFPDLMEFVTSAADRHGKLVILAGLDGDYKRRRFGQVLDLVPHADDVVKLHARCAYCDCNARFTLRIVADERQEVVGGADKYAPVCRQHYMSLSSLREFSGASSQAGSSELAEAEAEGRQDPAAAAAAVQVEREVKGQRPA